MLYNRRSRFLRVVVLPLLLTACGGEESVGPTEDPPPSPPDLLTLHLEGTVLDVDQQPAPDAEVVLYSNSCFFGCRTSAVDSTLTGPTGRYSLVVPDYCTTDNPIGGSQYVQAKHRRGLELQAGKTFVACSDSVQQIDIQLCRARDISGGGFNCVR